MNFEEEEKTQNYSNIIVFIVSFLLLASISLSVIGLVKGKKEVVGQKDIEPSDYLNEFSSDFDQSLSDVFEKNFSEESSSTWKYPNDPFREICKDVEGEGYAMTSFTVCQP